MRCGALFPYATELLKVYIKGAEDLIQEENRLTNDDKIAFNCLIALYSDTASRPYRIKLLNEAESLLDESETAKKSTIKINKGIIHLHFNEFDEAKKCFNAAEHFIFKTSWKSFERKTRVEIFLIFQYSQRIFLLLWHILILQENIKS